MSKEKNHSIQAVLTVYSPDLSSSIEDRIRSSGEFTTVTHDPPSEIKPIALALLALDRCYTWGHDSFLITHLGIIKKGQRVATGQVRLVVTDLIELHEIKYKDLINGIPKKLQRFAINAFYDGYKKVSPKTGEHLLQALLELSPSQKSDIYALISKLNHGKEIKQTPRNQDAAVEKDALGLSLDIFGANRKRILKSWNAQKGSMGQSFLSGLNEYAAYEDDVISHDLNTLPGWNVISKSITGVVEFKSKTGQKLIVINANRKPIEKATGVDLVYFHRDYEAFTFVQYKMMDKQGKGGSDYYYNPNQNSHEKEFVRLKKLQQLIDNEPTSDELSDYRLVQTPIFFKVCKKLLLKADNTSIAAGAYLPLDQWQRLIVDPSTKGTRGGCQIGYHTLKGRYIGTKTFVDLLQKGFLGTHSRASQKIALFVEEAIKSGHSVIYSIEQKDC